ncbi:TetR/AcrR family transcriptional regulator [Methylomonas sp. AM2-LC]|uniref:TetR/AcrR family transcriptional regulator n=1 Tax=Methylomonas sp. AM2-LC TaxID=3153301 RepID=UPI0032679052
MARRGDHSLEQIQEMILDTARNIVNEQGIHALTVRKIALDVGYTVGSVYMVFANMQELVMHIKASTLEEITAQLHNVSAELSMEQKILVMAENYHQFATENFNRWSIIFNTDSPVKDEIPSWYREKVESLFVPVEAVFKQLNPNSSFEQQAQAARTLLCGVHGVCLLALNGNLGQAGIASSAIAVRLLVESFVQGWKQQLAKLPNT